MGIAQEFNILDVSEYARESIQQGITDIWATRFKPPPKLDLVEWADTYRKLPDNSAESGQWKTRRVEVSRKPMQSISDKTVKEITVMSCIQLMKTELMINTALYYMHQDPSPLMYVAPKKEIAEAWSKERFTKSVNATPVLKDIFAKNRHGEGNTILQKQYPGGQISIVSARNPDDLAMRACRIMLFDECDKYPMNVGAGEGGSGGEGDPIAVAWGRATTYGNRAKKIVACSPTVQGKSRVEAEYLASNQSVFLQPCPHCDHAKELEWPDVCIPVDEETGEYLPKKAHVVCSECQKPWTEADRHKSINNGFWYAKKPEITHHHGYKVSSFASPFTPIVTLAIEFVKAMGNANMLKAFYNTRMARTWREDGDQPDWEKLYDRRESLPFNVMAQDSSMLTMGIDIQKDGAWYETVAWGRRKRSWSVDMGFIEGDIEDDDFREKLKELFDKYYDHASGVSMQCEKIGVDSGYKTQAVYSLVREYGDSRVIAVKGEKEENLTSIVGAPVPVDVNWQGNRISRGLKLWKVGSGTAKAEFYGRLGIKKPDPEKIKNGALYPRGYPHFPEWDEEYFKQITAEVRIRSEDKRGWEKYVWERVRKDNHLLDCRIYARAGSVILGIDRMDDEAWEERELALRVREPEPVDEVELDYKDVPADNVRNKPRRNSWMRK